MRINVNEIIQVYYSGKYCSGRVFLWSCNYTRASRPVFPPTNLALTLPVSPWNIKRIADASETSNSHPDACISDGPITVLAPKMEIKDEHVISSSPLKFDEATTIDLVQRSQRKSYGQFTWSSYSSSLSSTRALMCRNFLPLSQYGFSSFVGKSVGLAADPRH